MSDEKPRVRVISLRPAGTYTYTDKYGDKRCDDCDELIPGCACTCSTTGAPAHECTCIECVGPIANYDEDES